MTFDELLTKISSYELTQWIAFERVNGPLGPQYSNDMLANIHEQLQAVQFILGRMSAGEDSPVPQPHKMLRAHEVLTHHPVESFETDSMDLESFTAVMQAEERITEYLPGTE